MSEQTNSTRCPCPLWEPVWGPHTCLFLGMFNMPSGWLWCLFGKFCCIGKTGKPSPDVSFNVIGGFNVKVRKPSMLQASIVQIAETRLPLLVSSPQRLTAWWCWFTMYVLFGFWLLHLRSMCGARTVWSATQKADGRTCHVAKPFGVSVYCIRPLFTTSCENLR